MVGRPLERQAENKASGVLQAGRDLANMLVRRSEKRGSGVGEIIWTQKHRSEMSDDGKEIISFLRDKERQTLKEYSGLEYNLDTFKVGFKILYAFMVEP